MLTFKELQEKLMIFGKRAYPQFGNVVILVGGAGSGKGFQTSNLLGIEGKTFDVDKLKELTVRLPKFTQKIKDETGHDITQFNMKNPEEVSKLHDILASVYRVPNKSQEAMFGSILTSENKPNLIFDVTLKDITKLESISRNVRELGYDKKNIHIVWIVNDLDVAREQNKKRSRVVSDEILLVTHKGASMTMKEILDMGNKITKYMDGVIYISFNKIKVDTTKVDSETSKTGTALPTRADSKGSYIKDANYIKVKEQGKPQISSEELPFEVYSKIKKYTPDIEGW
jgi:hypothetical protein